MPHRRTTDTELILIWAVQTQGPWRSITTELSPDAHSGWPPPLSQRCVCCSITIEDREVSWIRQHPSRTGQSRWRGCHHCSYNNLQQDLENRRMASPVDPVLGHHTSRERQPAVVPELPNDQPHQPLKQSHAEDHTEQIEATSREDRCWRAGRLQSRKEHYREVCEKYLQHQQNLYHVFIDLKKAFDRVWHAALLATMKKYNIRTNLIWVIKNLYDKAISAALFNSCKGDWFQTRVGVWQGCLLSPTLFNIFLERISTDALEDYEGTTGGWTITNLRFADDIEGIAGEEEELAQLVQHLDKASAAYGMEISVENTKLMTNNTSSINTDIKVNGQKLETVTSFKYLGSVITDEGSKP